MKRRRREKEKEKEKKDKEKEFQKQDNLKSDSCFSFDTSKKIVQP
jgi:hypothetical protein